MLDEVEKAVVGKREPLTLVLSADPREGPRAARGLPRARQDPGRPLVRPGARAGLRARAVHPRPAAGRPDRLVPLRPAAGDFEFRRGPLFTGLLLADEINRTPPKTQSALLEAMQERQVTVEGETFALPDPFHVLATANPIEYEGTYPLPEAQLDRFLLRVSFGYPHRRRGVRRPHAPARRGSRRRSTSTRSPTPAGAAGHAGGGRDGHGRRERRPLLRRPRGGHPRPPRRAHRRVAARLARPGAGGARLRGAARPRLRHPRGRQGGGARGAGAPDHRPARALDDPGQRPRVVDAVLAPVADPRALERR